MTATIKYLNMNYLVLQSWYQLNGFLQQEGKEARLFPNAALSHCLVMQRVKKVGNNRKAKAGIYSSFTF